MKKIIWITGASSGFGKLTAKKLLQKKDCTVYVSARKIEKMKDLKELGANIIKADVTKDEDISKAIQIIIKNEKKIDVLIANAGFGDFGVFESVSINEAKYLYEVNVFGVARCINAVLPYMRKNRSGRIIITESLVSNLSIFAQGWYASTKHALKALSMSLRQELKEFGIKVISIQPGVVNTNFEKEAFDLLNKKEPHSDYKKMVANFSYYIKGLYKKGSSPKSTVKAMIKATTDKSPKNRYRTTIDATLLPIVVGLIPEKIVNKLVIFNIKRAGKKS